MGVSRRKVRERAHHEARRGARLGGLVGLFSRGILYLVLAVLALNLVFGTGRGSDVDARGAMEELAGEGLGSALLIVLAIGFAGFALWNAYEALSSHRRSQAGSERIADVGRAVVYGLLCVLAVSFVLSPNRGGDTDRKQQTWTAEVLEWPGGRLLVGAVGLCTLAIGLLFLWRAISGGRQDSYAVLEVAPRETRSVHALGALGNVARGAVVVLIGVFIVIAALDHDADETAGLDGSLKRLLDEPYGDILVAIVAIGLVAFAAYSIARAVVNSKHAVNAS